jgi:CubicO group peptidase (beta-lactamase class C family)
MKKIFLLFLISAIAIFGVELNAQEKADYKELNNYLEKYVKEFEMPGFALGIIKNDEIVFMETYGVKNVDSGKKVDENTLFGIASCSKAFTSACISILVDRGVINWKDKVVDLIPGFKLYDPYLTAQLTVEDLLAHRSGYETFDGDLIWYGTKRSTREVMERFRFRKNPYSLREEFGYSNLMFITAGELIESVTGKSWAEFVDENILDDINMTSSTTTNDGFENNKNAAWPHLDGKSMEFINYDNIGGAGAINSSISEMMNWAKLILNKGKTDDTIVFSERNYYKMVSQHTVLNAGKGETINGTHFAGYALGWFLKDFQGKKIIYHGGGLPGFHSKVVVVPEENLAYVILANQLSALVPAIDRKVLNFYLNSSDTTNWAALYLDAEANQKEQLAQTWIDLENERVKNTKPSLNDSAYVGVFEDEMYGKAKIEISDGELKITLLPTAKLFTSKMQHWHYDTFKIEFNDPFLPAGFVTFNFNEQKEITGFRIKMDAPDFHFNKLEFKKI